MKNLSPIRVFFAFLICLVSAQSQAALLLEPLVGYSVGKFNTEVNPGSVDDDESLSGISYGGRVGYQNLGFQLGLDYLASNLAVDDDDLKTSELGAFVGFEFPILVRVYAGYVFSGKGNYEVKNGGEFEFEGATGPKIGVGFTLLPFLDVNLEYRRISYDTYDLPVGSLDADYSATMLSFSLPFTI